MGMGEDRLVESLPVDMLEDANVVGIGRLQNLNTNGFLHDANLASPIVMR